MPLTLPNPLKPGVKPRCSWSSSDRQCSNYIWMISKSVAYLHVAYIGGLIVIEISAFLCPRGCGCNSKSVISKYMLWISTLRQRQNGRHFADNIFKCIFVNEDVRISIKISLKFVPKVPINNIPALVQIMAWRRAGDKPLSEPMLVSLPTHICVTRPQWVKFISASWDIALRWMPQNIFDDKSS